MITLVLEPHRTEIGELVADYPADHCQSARHQQPFARFVNFTPLPLVLQGPVGFLLPLPTASKVSDLAQWIANPDGQRRRIDRHPDGLQTARTNLRAGQLPEIPGSEVSGATTSPTSLNFGSVELGRTTADTSTLSATGGSCHNLFRLQQQCAVRSAGNLISSHHQCRTERAREGNLHTQKGRPVLQLRLPSSATRRILVQRNQCRVRVPLP
jgi:hypothetical protein